MTITIHQGDALEVLRTLPEESVHCVVTSPPYWGLRCYGVDGQLGLEKTPAEHVEKMVEVFREVRRVLRGDGCLFLNYGDTYASGACGGGSVFDGGRSDGRTFYEGDKPRGRDATKIKPRIPGLKPKDLVGMPWMLAFALRDDGWYLRSDIIWHKPNPMPESVLDRPTKAHEYVFMLTKSPRYFYDGDAVRKEAEYGRRDWQGADQYSTYCNPKGRKTQVGYTTGGDPSTGRNLRDVWTIPTAPFPSAHFATFPPALVEPCVKAGTSEKGCCAECGALWERMVEKSLEATRGNVGFHKGEGPRVDSSGMDAGSAWNHSGGVYGRYRTDTIAWNPTCTHDAPVVPCTVLDPFFGAGTVGLVADRLGRDAVGIELNPEYVEMARKRLRDDCPMFTRVEVVCPG